MAGSGITSKLVEKKPHLVKGGNGGVAAAVSALRGDLVTALRPLGAITVEEWTNPVAADDNAIKTSIATAATEQTYTGSALNGIVGTAVMSPARNITVTTTDDAGTWDGVITVYGLDANGFVQTEEITLANNTVIAGVKAFKKVTKLVVDAQNNTDGAFIVGFGDLIGLTKKPKARAGLACILKEIYDGGVVTNGALDATNATYAPNTAPNGAHDYAVYYEFDPTV